MALVAMATLSFGFSRSFPFACVVGLLSGTANGVVIVGKAMIYEVSDSSNQSYGIASLSLSWGLGSLVGPMLGGFLSKYKAVAAFPYLVPSIALASFAVAMLAVALKFLREPRRGGVTLMTLDDEEAGEAAGSAKPLILSAAGEAPVEADDWLCQQRRRSRGFTECSEDAANCRHRGDCGGGGGGDQSDNKAAEFQSLPNIGASRRHHPPRSRQPQLPVTPQQQLQQRQAQAQQWRHDSQSVALMAGVAIGQSVPDIVATSATPGDAQQPKVVAETTAGPVTNVAATASSTPSAAGNGGGVCGFLRSSNLWRILSNCECLLIIFLYFLLSACVVYENTLVIVWMPTSSYYGGLGFSTQELATVLSSSALSLMFIQPVLFPLLERRLGATRLYIHTMLFALISSVSLPLIHYAMYSPPLMWSLCIALMCLMSQAYLTSFSCTTMLVNNSVPSDLVGSMNGLSMACSSLGRLLGPLASGSIFAVSIESGRDYPLDFNVAFQLLGLLLIGCALMGFKLSPRLNKKFEERG